MSQRGRVRPVVVGLEGELSARLLERLGAMVELTAWIALANLAARTNVAFGIESQGFAAECGLAPLAQPGGVASRP